MFVCRERCITRQKYYVCVHNRIAYNFPNTLSCTHIYTRSLAWLCKPKEIKARQEYGKMRERKKCEQKEHQIHKMKQSIGRENKRSAIGLTMYLPIINGSLPYLWHDMLLLRDNTLHWWKICYCYVRIVKWQWLWRGPERERFLIWYPLPMLAYARRIAFSYNLFCTTNTLQCYTIFEWNKVQY